jgi:hypothetical protein
MGLGRNSSPFWSSSVKDFTIDVKAWMKYWDNTDRLIPSMTDPFALMAQPYSSSPISEIVLDDEAESIRYLLSRPEGLFCTLGSSAVRAFPRNRVIGNGIMYHVTSLLHCNDIHDLSQKLHSLNLSQWLCGGRTTLHSVRRTIRL